MPGTGLKLALAVIGGYLLGRTKKMKLAIMFGAALAGKKISTDPAQLLGQASKLIQASPELQKLDGAVRGRLLEAGKDAALAVASSRMEALTDNLVNRVENLGQAGRGRGGCGDAGRRSDRRCRRRRRRPGRWCGRRRRPGRPGRPSVARSAVPVARSARPRAADVVARRLLPRSRSTTAWTPPTRSRTSRISTTTSTTRRSPSRTRPWPRPRRPTSPRRSRRPPRGPRRAARALAAPVGIVEELRQQLVEQRLDQRRHRPGASQAVVVGLVVRRQREPHQQRLDASDVVGVAQQGHRRLRLAPWIGEAR